ncbi:MAG TPA: hypothetical protein VIJ38_05900 [Acidobacteriaceae bacterium]
MRWKIGECEFDSVRNEITNDLGVSQLGEKDAILLEAFVQGFGSKLNKDDLIQKVWPETGSEKSFHTSIKLLRDAFGGDRYSYIRAGPFRLLRKPVLIEDDVSATTPSAALSVHQPSLSEPSKEATASAPKDFTLIVDGMIINSVAELLVDDPETEHIRQICASSYERSLEDLAFATVYASHLVTGRDFRASLTTPDQPGQEIAAHLGEICLQRAYPTNIGNGHLLLDKKVCDGIRKDIRTLASCVIDRSLTHFFRDYMLREAAKHLGTDDSLFYEDLDPVKYAFNVKRAYYTNRQLQDELGKATDHLVRFLPKHPGNPDHPYARNALREFATRNVLSLITIMWEAEEFRELTNAKKMPHVLRALVLMRRTSGDTKQQEYVRDLVVQYALTAALRHTPRKKKYTLIQALLNLRDDSPFKEIREILNRHHLILVEPGIHKEEEASRALKELKRLATPASADSDVIHLSHSSVLRAWDGTRAGEYEYELYRVFPELNSARV